jgi:capsid protein
MLTDDPSANDRIEHAFEQWAHAVDLAEKLRTLRLARAESGEAFVILTSNPRIESPIKLDLRLIEADQVASPFGSQFRMLHTGGVDGIVFDPFGNPIAYRVLRRHPGDGGPISLTNLGDYDLIPADAIIHYFRVDRPGQSRGIPDITSALHLPPAT